MAPSVAEALAWLRERLKEVDADTAETEALWILAHALGLKPARVWLERRTPLAEETWRWLQEVAKRRQAREPLAYILGETEFFGLRLEVSPAVMVPRPETERLVEVALERLVEEKGRLRIADIGTGSGAIAIALAVHLPHATFYATDISPEALAVAQRNARRHGVAERFQWAIGSLLEPFRRPSGREWEEGLPLDAIVSNPPYIPTALLEALQPEISRYEPRQALDGGADGLEVVRALLEQAPSFLRGRGWLFCEIGHDQGEVALAWACSQPLWEEVEVLPDWGGRSRVVVARRVGKGASPRA